jgi:hypothetical protein
MAFTGPLEDRQLIRERGDAYSDAASRGDAEAWLGNWTEDATWSVLGQECHGKPALRALWGKLWETMQRVTFFSQLGAVEVLGTRAVARSYCREILFFTNGNVRELIGGYDDELVRENGVWLFARRKHFISLIEAKTALTSL